MNSKRKLLFVIDSACTRFTAMKRGLAYAPLFALDSMWQAEFVDRNPPTAPPLNRMRRLGWRVARRLRRQFLSECQLASRDDEIVARAKHCDLVYLLKTPAADLQRRILALNGPRVVMDMNDAIWLPRHRNGFERLEEMLATAHGVVCENHYVADYVQKYNSRIRIVPDFTQLGEFDAHRKDIARDNSKVRLGWIGSPNNGGFLYAIWEPLEELFARHCNLELRVLGAAAQHLPPFEKVRWSSIVEYDREQMAREALAMDIGLFPLFRVEESLARGNGKAVLYMAAEAVAVCEDLGENARLIQDGVNGVLARGPEEWLAKLDWLVTHPQERYRIARAGLQTVREQLADSTCFEHLIDALNWFDSLGNRNRS